MTSNNNGYSLIEVMIAAAIVGIIIIGGSQALELAGKGEKQARVLHSMDTLYRDLHARATSPFSILYTANQDIDGALARCLIPPRNINQINSTCPLEARSSSININATTPPGLPITMYGLAPAADASVNPGNIEVRPLTGTIDDPVRYRINGDLCPGSCLEYDHFEARSWFYVECVENDYLTQKCTRAKYIPDNISIYVELMYIRRHPRTRAQPPGRWDCRSQVYASRAAVSATSRRAIIVHPRPGLIQPCRTVEKFTSVAISKVHNIDSQQSCNDNAAVAGFETDGRPICQCIPPYIPRIENNELVTNRQGPLCELKGSCNENEIFRGFQVREDAQFRNLGRGSGVRYRTTPLCVPVEEQEVECGSNSGRLRSFTYNCRLRGNISEDGGTMKMSCDSSEKRETKCFIER